MSPDLTGSSAIVQLIPFLVLASYLIMLLTLGCLGYRQRQAGEEDYYLAGRAQGWGITAMTIMATFFSSFALLGAPGMVYREGVVFALVSLNVPVAGYCVYLLGGKIWKAGQKGAYVTPADMICDHYKSHVFLRLLVVLVGVLFTIPYVMMQLKAGGELAAVLFSSYPGAFDLGAVVLATITTLYIMIGGMRSVAWTDALQCFLLVTGMLVSGAALVRFFDGFSNFSEAITRLPKASLTLPGNTGFWSVPMLLTVSLLMPIGGMIQPAQWMRFYAARDLNTLRRSALIFIILLTGCFLLGIMLVGLGGQILFPLQIDEIGNVTPHQDVGSFDQILVAVVKKTFLELLGPSLGMTLASVIVVAIMAAAMSTADSSLHALSALLTRDVYSYFIRPDSGQSERVWVGRLVILGATLFSLVFVLGGKGTGGTLAGTMDMIVGLGLFAAAFSIQLLPVTVDVLYLHRGTANGAASGLVIGLVVAFCFTSLFRSLTQISVGCFVEPLLLPVITVVTLCREWLPIHAAAWGLIPNVLIFALVSSFSRGRVQC